MEQRLNYPKLVPAATRAMAALGSYLATCGLEPSLLELVRIRASQMNGCGFCIDMHTKDARAGGETEQRIYALNAWRETPFFSDRERHAAHRQENAGDPALRGRLLEPDHGSHHDRGGHEREDNRALGGRAEDHRIGESDMEDRDAGERHPRECRKRKRPRKASEPAAGRRHGHQYGGRNEKPQQREG
jgi:AhpD family alkylhydroperoxidase